MNRFFARQRPEGYTPPATADELLEQYSRGQRYFEETVIPEAELQGADLDYINLTKAQLHGVSLHKAVLNCAQLAGANFGPTRQVGNTIWSGAKEEDKSIGSDLTLAKLRQADLTGASLSHANLIRADLRSADLFCAQLPSTWMEYVKGNDANFRGANLDGALLYRANLTNADLRHAKLSRADLTEATLENVAIGQTIFLDTDVTPFCNVPLRFIGPCTFDWRTVARSLKAPRLQRFLTLAGMPDVVATYLISSLKSIDELELFTMLQSTFISYGGPDEAFAKKLHEALKKNGVNTWFFPENAIPGQRLHRTMHQGVNEYDRVILVCSKSSLDRGGVMNEIEQTLIRESREGGAEVLIPIRLDDYLFKEWKPERADLVDQIKSRVVADFTGAETDEGKFNEALSKLLLALRRPDQPGSKE